VEDFNKDVPSVPKAVYCSSRVGFNVLPNTL